eukprot:TRINITY_DN9054_c0_g2_i1.p1 TRINITY_DN9054_c0_g2~~TRINITY_DN9054_c0_g2_i1.p1  ORF type:complete len:628 (-),score=28.54 TRINITY_DN9054_c0_g2_i1:106-1989(-)
MSSLRRPCFVFVFSGILEAYGHMGNPACWSGGFTWKTCCDSMWGPQGNSLCWEGVFTHDACCTTSEVDETSEKDTSVSLEANAMDSIKIHECREACMSRFLPRRFQFARASSILDIVDGTLNYPEYYGNHAVCSAIDGMMFSVRLQSLSGSLPLDICAPKECSPDDVKDIALVMYEHLHLTDELKMDVHKLEYSAPLWNMVLANPITSIIVSIVLILSAFFGGGVQRLAKYDSQGVHVVHVMRLVGTTWLVVGHTLIVTRFKGLPVPTHDSSHLPEAPKPRWYVYAWHSINHVHMLFTGLSSICILLSTWLPWRAQSSNSCSMRLRLLIRKIILTWCRLVPPLFLLCFVRAFVNPLLSVHSFHNAYTLAHGAERVRQDQVIYELWPGLPAIVPYLFHTSTWLLFRDGQQLPVYVLQFEIILILSFLVFLACCAPRQSQHLCLVVLLSALLAVSKLTPYGTDYNPYLEFAALVLACAVLRDYFGSQDTGSKSISCLGLVLRLLGTAGLVAVGCLAMFYIPDYGWSLKGTFAMVLLGIFELWRDDGELLAGWERLARISYVTNVLHAEWFVFWLCAWGLGNTHLPPYFVMACAWSTFVLFFSLAGAAVAFVIVIHPVERGLVAIVNCLL